MAKSSHGVRKLFSLLAFGTSLLGIGAFLTQDAALAQGSPTDTLHSGFEAPPESAKPRVWWHWMNGNVTKYGIKADVDWMHKIGIGGMDVIDAALNTPQVVKKRMIYMHPDWKDAFHYAASLADKDDMALSINSSPGWSETGGPWVTPQEAMKKLVWTATPVEGGKHFDGVLPRPPDNTGPFQNEHMTGNWRNAKKYPFYRDAAVVAYKLPAPPPAVASVTSSGGPVSGGSLSDGNVTNGITLKPAAGGNSAWVEMSYKEPTRMDGVSLALDTAGAFGAAVSVEASQDGQAWHQVATMIHGSDEANVRDPVIQQTISFAPTTARYFRIVLRPGPPAVPAHIQRSAAPGAITTRIGRRTGPPPGPLAFNVHELVFHNIATVNQFEQKAYFSIARDYYKLATPAADAAPGAVVQPGNVVVLNDHMKADGTLDWTPPPGHWVVLRLGYSLLGTTNHPATKEATGLEVDKLNAKHVEKYTNNYLDTYEQVTGPNLFGKRGLKAMMVDSIEVGAQNWTEAMIADFKRIRGYDPTPWLPVLTGVVVGSPAQSDKFLWDFRTTVNELEAENHYAVIAKVTHQRGLTSYAEALENGRPSFGDDMRMRQFANIPMAAMWAWGSLSGPDPTYVADIQGAASVAHIYGQNLVAAESMTSAFLPWAYAPRELKPIIDMEFVTGVNRVVVHESAEQPVDKPPGLSLGIFGQMFDRLESWADYAKPWVSYMTRASYMLQQGHYAADVAYFYGQDAPITGLFKDKKESAVPAGYRFDYVNPDVLEHQFSVENGDLVTHSGMRYRVLYLGGSSQFISLPVLRRIGDLVNQGAVLVGKRPESSPSLADNEGEFKKLADALFGPAGSGQPHSYGKGKVYSSGSLADALAAMNVQRDFSYTKPEADTELLYLHRQLKDGDIYFVVNRKDRSEKVTASFRVSGRVPQIWDAVSGKVTPASYRMVGGRTEVPLTLNPYGSAFVVFRTPTNVASKTVPAVSMSSVATLSGPWKIAFQPGRGAPASITESKLAAWNTSDNQGVKYFSGTGTYTKTFNLPAGAMKPGARMMLDLGRMHELADVTLNGKHLGVVWTPPFKIDVTDALKPGANTLEIAVTNLWVNRLIGDQQPGAKKKYTFTIIPTYKPDAPLRSSGLLGPVTIEQVASK